MEIREDAFFMGELERSCESEIDFPSYYQGWFWIGRTMYEIWRVEIMVFCKLKMKKVTRNTYIMCNVKGAPNNCEYTDEELKQTSLEGLFG